MECMYAQTRPRFILSSERLSGDGVRTHVISKGTIPSTGYRTHDAASRRTASPTHYRLSYSGPAFGSILFFQSSCRVGPGVDPPSYVRSHLISRRTILPTDVQDINQSGPQCTGILGNMVPASDWPQKWTTITRAHLRCRTHNSLS